MKKTTNKGQAMTEYVIVCLVVAMILIAPYRGKPLYAWVVAAFRNMHTAYMNGMTVYAYPF